MHDAADLETTMLGPVLPDRSCGDCTACCTVLQVASPDFAKPAGVPCAHLGAKSCGIHAIRPHICRTWFCVWRREADLPETARPDRSGLLISMNFVPEPQNCFEGVSINVRLLAGSDAIENGLAGRVLDVLCDYLIPVWFSDGDKKMLMHPAPDIAELVLSGAQPPAPLREEVAAWREQYGMFARAPGR